MLHLLQQELAAQPTAEPVPCTSRRHRVATGLLTLGLALTPALVVRCALLDAESGWLDEGYSLAAARRPLGALIRFTAHFDTHPPLYYILLHVWASIAGTGLLAARLLSLLCGVGGAAALYMVAGRLFDRSTARRAALLLALSTLACWYADRGSDVLGGCWLLYVGAGALALYTVHRWCIGAGHGAGHSGDLAGGGDAPLGRSGRARRELALPPRSTAGDITDDRLVAGLQVRYGWNRKR